MKKILSIILTVVMMMSCTVIVGAASVNEPTAEELESVIKIVKPRLYVPEECSEFTWRFNAKNAYSDASWRFTWNTKDDSKKQQRVNVTCDIDGNIISYSYRDYDKKYGQFPLYSKDQLQKNADDFIKKALPNAYSELKLFNSFGGGLYSGEYTYQYIRYIDGHMFPDNYVNVSVDYNTGHVTSLNADYNYDLTVEKSDSVISPEKAEEILGTRQKMELMYLTKTERNEQTKEATVKAFLVYKPTVSYLAVDAITGEIYDTKSSWSVNDTFGGAAGGAMPENGVMMDKSESETTGEDYRLTDEELAGLRELEGLISKEEAIKTITESEYLYINPALTAVSANLSKNYSAEPTSTYRNDNGSYIWHISFSNPVIDDKYYSYAYANASVNAQTGEIISYDCNLNDYYYYSENKLDIPDVKFNHDESKIIAEKFLSTVADDKFKNTVEGNYSTSNMIKMTEANGEIIDRIYGAHNFGYTRVNEGIKFPRNYLNVGVDGVTGKIYRYNSNWWSNVDFESPVGAISDEEALSCLLECDGYGLIYERNITHIYTPVTEGSKRDICLAFVASLLATTENGGDTDVIIEKYAKNIDRDKLLEALNNKDEESLLNIACDHFGITVKEVEKAAEEFVDTSLFYDIDASARLVYTCYDLGSDYISPFTGKQLDGKGEEYKPMLQTYNYTDISGHWIEDDVMLLSDIGIGFEGGEFLPEQNITFEEFVSLSQSMNFYTDIDDCKGNITRIEAIRAIIDALGYEKVANLKNIYKTDFADNGDIKEEDLGYISIAYGFGIVKGDGSNVNAYSFLTRAQAVSLLINATKTTR